MKDRRAMKWLTICLLPGLLFLAACDSGDDEPDTIVVTNTVNGQDVIVTNTAALPEPETLLDRTYSVPAGATVASDAVVAPDDGTVSADVDWSGGGVLQADLIRNGADVAAQLDTSPLTISAQTDDGQSWVVAVANTTANNKNVHVTIRYTPE